MKSNPDPMTTETAREVFNSPVFSGLPRCEQRRVLMALGSEARYTSRLAGAAAYVGDLEDIIDAIECCLVHAKNDEPADAAFDRIWKAHELLTEALGVLDVEKAIEFVYVDRRGVFRTRAAEGFTLAEWRK